MSQLSDMIAALAAAAVPIGGGAAFVWNKIESRFREIDKQLEECRNREYLHLETQTADAERRARQLTVIELLWQEVTRLSPDGNNILIRAKRLLDGLKEGTIGED